MQTLILILFAIIVVLVLVMRFHRGTIRTLRRAMAQYRLERSAEESLLQRIGLCINSSLDLEGALNVITEHIVETTEAGAGAIFLLDSDGLRLHARSVTGLFPPMRPTSEQVLTKRKYLASLIKSVPIEIGEGIVGFVAKTGEAVLVSDGLNDPRVPKVATDYLQIANMIAAPLRLHQKILGVFAVVNKRLHGTFDERDLNLLQLLADQAALTVDVVKLYEKQAEQQRIEQELRVANEFQQMMLPREFPEVEGLEIAAFSHPALGIGGDYYDFIKVDEEHLGIAIVDVSGKGIPGALVMATVRSTLRAHAAGHISPKEVLQEVNRRLLGDTKDSVFITMIYGIVNIRTRNLRFVRAGHEPLVIWNSSSQESRLYQPEGIALGLVPDALFSIIEEREVLLEANDLVFFYTDGVIEACNQEKAEYGCDRMIGQLKQNPGLTADEQIRNILSDIQVFTGGVPQQDDITMVALKVAGDNPAKQEVVTDG